MSSAGGGLAASKEAAACRSPSLLPLNVCGASASLTFISRCKMVLRPQVALRALNVFQKVGKGCRARLAPMFLL
jgi:hypothetical protein